MRAIRTFLILSHRYIGIPLGFFFVMWFISGFFMIYTGGMPKVTPAMQVAGSEPLDFSRVKLGPAQAIKVAGYDAPAATLRTVLGRPVYELEDPGSSSTFVYADTGELMPPLTVQQSAELAGRFLDLPASQLQLAATLVDQSDQWTFTVARDLPLFKFVADDAPGTEVYVSGNAAKVSTFTTRRSRMFAWLGTIPHWLYFAGLRDNQPLWYSVVVWSAGFGCVSALLGLCLGFTQFRKVRPFRLQNAIPYHGLLRWHYLLGCLFGVVTLTWVFSGLVSMEPWAWTQATGIRLPPDTLSKGELKLQDFPQPALVDWTELSSHPIKQVEFVRVLGAPYFVAGYAADSGVEDIKRDRLHQPYNINGQLQSAALMVDATTGELHTGFDPVTLAATVATAVPAAKLVESALLERYDDYYYSRGKQLPLPVLRLKFNDPLQSWLYVDPKRGRVLSVVHKWSRLERWLYNGLHSLDFAFWYHRRPLWDVGMLLLLSGGLATSLLGLYFGSKRLYADLGRLAQRIRSRKNPKEFSHAS